MFVSVILKVAIQLITQFWKCLDGSLILKAEFNFHDLVRHCIHISIKDSFLLSSTLCMYSRTVR